MSSSTDLIASWKKNIISDKSKISFLLNDIKSHKHKNTNQFADEIHQKIFKKLDCLDCANCCKSIPPILNRTDANRIAKHLKISESEFYQKYLMTDEDGDTVFKTSPCVFLLEDNKCSIYEVRPIACREYPHTDHRQFTSNFKIHKPNANYCPAVYYIVLELREMVMKNSK